MILFLVKATILSFLWGFLSALYMLWTETEPNRLNTAIVFGPTVVFMTLFVLYAVAML